jgi:hypothetical protein
MTMLYHKLTFDLSQEAKDWVLNRYESRLKEKVWHDFDVSQYTTKGSQQEWHQSIAGKELNDFLSNYRLDSSYFGISAFISNINETYIGNPHIDSKMDHQLNVYRMKSRLNVMVLGNPEDPMIWWEHIDYDDPVLGNNVYHDIDKTNFVYPKSIPGKTKEDRIAFVGEPSSIVQNVLTPSAFLKVDCAHTVNVSPGPRLIVTVALDKTIEEILNSARVNNT